jgi:hypothetical protein
MTHVGAQQDKGYRDILKSTGRISLPVVLGEGILSGLSDGGWTSQGKVIIGGEMGRIDVAVSCGTPRKRIPERVFPSELLPEKFLG